MTYQQVRWIIAGSALALLLLLTLWIPWQALLMLLFVLTIVLVPVIGQFLQIIKAKTTPIPQYQPPAQTAASEPPLLQTYNQGYQAQAPASSTSWSSPTLESTDAQPHEDRPGAPIYEQPLVHYPDQQANF